MSVSEVERALLALDHHERAAVIHHGLRSLDDGLVDDWDQAEVDVAWRGELRKRIDDVENGRAELVDMDEAHDQIRAALAAYRR